MAGPTMTAAELAEELGRSDDWLWEQWRDLCKRDRMPHPLHGGARPLTWSRAQIVAWLDRDLDPRQRIAAAAYRAAEAAAAGVRRLPSDALAEDEARARLEELLR